MTRRKWAAILATSVSVAILATACGGQRASNDADSSQNQANENTPITFQLDWTWYASNHAFFVVGQQKGFYKQAGLNVTFREGNGSKTALKLIGTGKVPIGLIDAGTLIRGMAEGISDVKAIGVVSQGSPISVIFKAEKNYDSLQDLKGARIAGTQGDANGQILPAALAKAGLSMEDIEFVPTGNPQAKEAAVLRDNADALLGFFNDQAPRLEAEHGIKMDYIRFADAGVNVMSMSVVANTEWLAQNRSTAKKFLQATQRAVEYTVKHPREAARIFTHEHPEHFSQQLAYREIKMTIPLLHTKATEGKPYLVSARKDWRQSQRILEKYTDMKKTGVDVSDYYTNDLLR